MMLIIAFIAISIGCILLYNELKRFGEPFGNPPPWNTSGARASMEIDDGLGIRSLLSERA